jgi:hypothetical protein
MNLPFDPGDQCSIASGIEETVRPNADADQAFTDHLASPQLPTDAPKPYQCHSPGTPPTRADSGSADFCPAFRSYTERAIIRCSVFPRPGRNPLLRVT